MSEKARAQRVGELIRQEVAKLISNGIKDPRIGFVSVMGVKMSPDLHYANVYVSLYGDESQKKGSLVGLRRSAGWMRREVGKYLRMRYTPELRFFEDDSLEQVYRLEEVLEEIHEERRKAPLNHLTLSDIAEELTFGNSFLVTSHVSPDGDAVGSVLAMYHFLKALGKTEVYCYLSEPAPAVYQTLPGVEHIKQPGEEMPEHDTVVLLDISRVERTGSLETWVNRDWDQKNVILIDHHLDEHPEGKVGFIDSSYAATGEILADLFEAVAFPLTPEIAHCLYVAQITDTGGYRFSNTNARSHQIAATLHETGLDTAGICDHVFGSIPRRKFELLRRILHNTAFALNDSIAYVGVRQQDFIDIGATREDLNGIINHLLHIDGVRVAALFNELAETEVKVSFRADDSFNVADFCKAHGGGGHAAAAGLTVHSTLDAAMRDLLPALEQAMGDAS